MWARRQRWKVPQLHMRIVHWLEQCTERVRVLLVFRGAAKSTIFGVYKAWELYCDHTLRHQVWAADDNLALKMTRYTKHVLLTHPLCRGMLRPSAGSKQFWVDGATDMRNPSMAATGVGANATGSRADHTDFDDVEVPKNIKTPEGRETIRARMEESTHILVPGGRKTYIGTPHTHNSIYEEQITGGAAVLRIPLFEHSMRIDNPGTERRFKLTFTPAADGVTVMTGIGPFAKLLEEGRDYRLEGGAIVFATPPGIVFDVCSGNAWPERFTRAEILFKRSECRTLNAWDSQYQLHSKPAGEIRLDPERLRIYDVQPIVREANGGISMFLGNVQIVGAIAWWDCSLGKIKSDASALTLLLTDARGNLYWHVAEGLTGELEAQCAQIRVLVVKFQIPRVIVETNGPGGFVPPILRAALKGTGCSVGEEFAAADKRKRILDAFEPPMSARFLWAHTSVVDGPAWDQMKDFNPGVRDQPDDYLDSAAGAISATPVRIGKTAKNPGTPAREDWRPSVGVHEVTLET